MKGTASYQRRFVVAMKNVDEVRDGEHTCLHKHLKPSGCHFKRQEAAHQYRDTKIYKVYRGQHLYNFKYLQKNEHLQRREAVRIQRRVCNVAQMSL